MYLCIGVCVYMHACICVCVLRVHLHALTHNSKLHSVCAACAFARKVLEPVIIISVQTCMLYAGINACQSMFKPKQSFLFSQSLHVLVDSCSHNTGYYTINHTVYAVLYIMHARNYMLAMYNLIDPESES